MSDYMAEERLDTAIQIYVSKDDGSLLSILPAQGLKEFFQIDEGMYNAPIYASVILSKIKTTECHDELSSCNTLKFSLNQYFSPNHFRSLKCNDLELFLV